MVLQRDDDNDLRKPKKGAKKSSVHVDPQLSRGTPAVPAKKTMSTMALPTVSDVRAQFKKDRNDSCRAELEHKELYHYPTDTKEASDVLLWCECDQCYISKDTRHPVVQGCYYDNFGKTTRVVVKIFRAILDSELSFSKLTGKQAFEREVQAVKRLEGGGGIVFTVMDLDYNKGGPVQLIATRYRTGGSLKDHLGAFPGNGVSDDQRLVLMRAIVNAMAEVHKAQLVHGDVKPANILVEEDDEYDADGASTHSGTGISRYDLAGHRERPPKIYFCDFEFARFERPQSSGKTLMGFTPLWASYRQRNTSFASKVDDLWSLGLVLSEVWLCGRTIERVPVAGGDADGDTALHQEGIKHGPRQFLDDTIPLFWLYTAVAKGSDTATPSSFHEAVMMEADTELLQCVQGHNNRASTNFEDYCASIPANIPCRLMRRLCRGLLVGLRKEHSTTELEATAVKAQEHALRNVLLADPVHVAGRVLAVMAKADTEGTPERRTMQRLDTELKKRKYFGGLDDKLLTAINDNTKMHLAEYAPEKLSTFVEFTRDTELTPWAAMRKLRNFIAHPFEDVGKIMMRLMLCMDELLADVCDAISASA